MPRGRQPEGENALSNAERQARYRARHESNSQRPWSATDGQPTGVPAHSAGTTRSPG